MISLLCSIQDFDKAASVRRNGVFFMDFTKLATMLIQLLEGLAVSFYIFALTLLFSIPLGLIISFGRMSKNPVIKWIARMYISIMRGTPLMLQLFVVYFGPFLYFWN